MKSKTAMRGQDDEPYLAARHLSGAGALIVAFRLSGAYAQTETGNRWRRLEARSSGSLDDTPESTPGFASTHQVPLRFSPERPNAARVSRRRCSRSRQRGSRFRSIDCRWSRQIPHGRPMKATRPQSHSMQDSGTAIRHAAAQAREILRDEAARRLGVTATSLQVRNGEGIRP